MGGRIPVFYSLHRTAVAPQAAARFDPLALAVSHPNSVGGFLSWKMERNSLFCMADGDPGALALNDLYTAPKPPLLQLNLLILARGRNGLRSLPEYPIPTLENRWNPTAFQ